MADHEIAAAGNSEFDAHDGRDRAGYILGALVDADPAGGEPLINFFKVGNAGPDFILGTFRSLDIVKGDFKRHLHGGCSLPLSPLGASLVSRFRRLYPVAAHAFTSVGTKGTLATHWF